MGGPPCELLKSGLKTFPTSYIMTIIYMYQYIYMMVIIQITIEKWDKDRIPPIYQLYLYVNLLRLMFQIILHTLFILGTIVLYHFRIFIFYLSLFWGRLFLGIELYFPSHCSPSGPILSMDVNKAISWVPLSLSGAFHNCRRYSEWLSLSAYNCLAIWLHKPDLRPVFSFIWHL